MSKNEQSARDGWKRLAEAVAFALEAHAQQMRKGTDTPYVSHLLGVASLVLEHGVDEEQAMAAMLHDAVEDLGADLEPAIREQFGARVADIVLGCTDADTLPKPPWRARKKNYIRHLEHAAPDVLLVSCADKVHNARAICTDVRTHGPDVFGRSRRARTARFGITERWQTPSSACSLAPLLMNSGMRSLSWKSSPRELTGSRGTRMPR